MVGCVLAMTTWQDIHAAGVHPLRWDQLYDNMFDQNPLAALPAGIGLTASFDGSDNTITTTEAGVWAFTTRLMLEAADPDWLGLYTDGVIGTAMYRFGVAAGASPLMLIPAVAALPSGAILQTAVITDTPASVSPYNLTLAYCAIVRLS
jgi:hypothetical protein